MDPLGTVQAVIGSIQYLISIADKVKENGEECRRLCDHASRFIGLVETEYRDGVPSKLATRLVKLQGFACE